LHAKHFVPTKNAPELLASPFGRPGAGGPPPGAGGGIGRPAGAASEHPVFELAEVMLGHEPPRDRPDQIVGFNLARPYGWDTPILNWAYDWARQRGGVGTEIHLTSDKPGLFPSW
ncbi:MAG TPA: hypothetical protein VF157_13235, partial [Chloroflexota bacterium]